MSKVVNPLVAGVRMGLRSDKYSKNAKNRASKAIKTLANKEHLAEAIREQLAMLGVFPEDSDTEDDVDEIVEYNPNLELAPALSQDKLDRIAKRLWAEYPQKFNEKNADLGTFLNDFVELMNEFHVNFQQAKGLLRRHIDSKLKSHIKANEELGLGVILKNLRRFKCQRQSRNQVRSNLASWKLNLENILSSIFDLKTLMLQAYPGQSIANLATPVKEKVLSQLPEAARNEMATLERRFERKHGAPMDVEKFAAKLNKLTITKRRREVNQVSIPQAKLFSEKELQEKIMKVRDEERAKYEMNQQQQQQLFYQSQPPMREQLQTRALTTQQPPR